jgi:hypothetical protein
VGLAGVLSPADSFGLGEGVVGIDLIEKSLKGGFPRRFSVGLALGVLGLGGESRPKNPFGWREFGHLYEAFRLSPTPNISAVVTPV